MCVVLYSTSFLLHCTTPYVTVTQRWVLASKLGRFQIARPFIVTRESWFQTPTSNFAIVQKRSTFSVKSRMGLSSSSESSAETEGSAVFTGVGARDSVLARIRSFSWTGEEGEEVSEFRPSIFKFCLLVRLVSALKREGFREKGLFLVWQLALF